MQSAVRVDEGRAFLVSFGAESVWEQLGDSLGEGHVVATSGLVCERVWEEEER